MYNNWAWDKCDATLDRTNCRKIGFTDPSDKFYQPGDFPANGTSTLHNIAGTVTAPPSGTVFTWSQASTTWTVAATGYNAEAVASQSEYRATATDLFPAETGVNRVDGVNGVNAAAAVAGSVPSVGGAIAALGFVGVLMAL